MSFRAATLGLAAPLTAQEPRAGGGSPLLFLRALATSGDFPGIPSDNPGEQVAQADEGILDPVFTGTDAVERIPQAVEVLRESEPERRSSSLT
jgi:hypothetical protein